LLILILAESAVELVPESILNHPAVKSHAERRGKTPRQLMLDRSYHHAAMRVLPNNEKRGRPDIVHFALLEALGSPLNKEGLLQTYVHTINDFVIYVNPKTRLPRNYNRFVGLMEQLFQHGQVPPSSEDEALLRLERKNLSSLFEEIKPDYTLAFTREGEKRTLEEALLKVLDVQKLAVLIGGFPHGHFKKTTLKLANEAVCIDKEPLDAWTVVSRVVYEYERSVSITEKRLKNAA